MSSKTWLITGASRGLGFELAKVALAAGHTVVACYRSSSKDADAIAKIERLGGTWIQLDVASDDVESKIAEVVQKHGRIDVLVNNAGYGLGAAVEDTSIDQIQALFKVNFIGPLRTIKAVVPSMRTQGGGTIVNVSSQNAIAAIPGLSIYSASKFALEGASEGLQGELAPFNIRILLAEPGALATRFTDAGAAAVTAPVSDPYKGTPVEYVLNSVQDVSGYMKQARSPEKAAERIVEAVDGTGMLKGKDVGLRLPLGDTGSSMAEKGKQLIELSESMKDVWESI